MLSTVRQNRSGCFKLHLFLVPLDPVDILMPPRREASLSDDERKLVVRFLHRFTGLPRTTCGSVVPDALPQYAKTRVDKGGDTMHARDLVQTTDRSRDASYVRVSMLCILIQTPLLIAYLSTLAWIDKETRSRHGDSFVS